MRADRILIVDDDDALRRMLVDYLSTQGYTALGVRSVQQGEEALRTDTFDLVIADLRLEDGSGLDLLKQLKQLAPRTYGILMTGYATMETAVEAIRIGLFDYMIKPIVPAQLDLVLQRLESMKQLQSENSYLRQQVQADGEGSGVVWGRSELMQNILEMVKKVAQTHATVLIQGESGTGKEVVAHAIVQHSSRAQMPFIKVNCAAVPETLLESEFFGHEKGAFTGAVQRREGRFETANGGTLLLDEIAEIPLSLQVKLLRVLQEREFERVGGNKTIRVDVRLIASTNRDLQEEVKQGRFREDLFYRLNVVPINLPPLRLRGDDLQDLVEFYVTHFARKHGKVIHGVTPLAMERLRGYRWPGNVRELQNTLERAVIMAPQDGPVEVPELGLDEKGPRIIGLNAADALPTVSEMERRLIGSMLLQTSHNKTRAAEKLGISLRTLRNKLREYRAAGYDTSKPELWVA
ncbi:MAG TPA: sigma-54 dependent transcriptional regulator [Candidatus Methylacidiphilales bacterium]|jgi:DNA-binding NtrC family response regulator|nr:sigma-54 dependent transcriptional regulator [Candidatus Methylacidiphilales bacterium]